MRDTSIYGRDLGALVPNVDGQAELARVGDMEFGEAYDMERLWRLLLRALLLHQGDEHIRERWGGLDERQDVTACEAQRRRDVYMATPARETHRDLEDVGRVGDE